MLARLAADCPPQEAAVYERSHVYYPQFLQLRR